MKLNLNLEMELKRFELCEMKLAMLSSTSNCYRSAAQSIQMVLTELQIVQF